MCIQVNSILQIAVAAARTRLQGTAEAGDAQERCDEEHAGNDDNPPRVCEQSLFCRQRRVTLRIRRECLPPGREWGSRP